MIPRCQIVPLADSVFSFEVDGRVLLHWNAAQRYQRPYFFPVYGPGQALMTRMGHPGAPDHDHHNSIWFAHHRVMGIDFWSSASTASVRQLGWIAMRDGMEEAVLAVRLGWFDGHDPQALLEQELVICVVPDASNENWSLELQSRWVPQAESLEFQKTNFGFLAVRVAKSISAHFGGGEIISSEGEKGEAAIFGKAASWIDYSGPISSGLGQQFAGITFFNHPQNPNSPVSWHVREDGWMGAGACLNNPLTTRRDDPVLLRYLLHIHAGPLDRQVAEDRLARWAKQPPFVATTSKRKHEMYEIWRSSDNR